MSNDKKAMDMLSKALEMEEKGKLFYANAIAICKNSLGIEIFQTLQKDEFVHIDRIKIIYADLQSGDGWTSKWEKLKADHADLSDLFKSLVAKHKNDIKAETGDLEALSVGIDFEQKSVIFYQDHLKQAKDDIERRFTKLMVSEEKKHLQVLSDTKFYLANPAAWFAERERASFDGQ